MANVIEIQVPQPYGCLIRNRFTVTGRYQTDAGIVKVANLKIKVMVDSTTETIDVDPTGGGWENWSATFTGLLANDAAVVTARLLQVVDDAETELDSVEHSPVRLRDRCVDPEPVAAPAAKQDGSAPAVIHRTVTTTYPVGDESKFHRIVAVVLEKKAKGNLAPVVWSVVEATFRGGVLAAVIPLPDPGRVRKGFEYEYYFLMLDPSNRIDTQTLSKPLKL